MCKEIIPIFLCVALLLSFTLPEIGDYTIRELIYGVQDTTTVVRGTRIACEIIAVSNPGYVVYTIYGLMPNSGLPLSLPFFEPFFQDYCQRLTILPDILLTMTWYIIDLAIDSPPPANNISSVFRFLFLTVTA